MRGVESRYMFAVELSRSIAHSNFAHDALQSERGLRISLGRVRRIDST
jgi:hypothetical protein